jgi:hypothetical protein
MGTQHNNGVQLFLLRRDLFFCNACRSRLHILDFIVILGEGAVKFRLLHGGVLPGLLELFF